MGELQQLLDDVSIPSSFIACLPACMPVILLVCLQLFITYCLHPAYVYAFLHSPVCWTAFKPTNIQYLQGFVIVSFIIVLLIRELIQTV